MSTKPLGRFVLATDLDGTLIPLPGVEGNTEDLDALKRLLAMRQIPLVFATGRHLGSIVSAIESFSLPIPDWIIADVGTTIYQRNENGWESMAAYAQHLEATLEGAELADFEHRFRQYDGLTLQAMEKQSRFKLSYDCPRDSTFDLAMLLQNELDAISAPFAITASLDPFTAQGLIDVLPRAASKARALQWWAETKGCDFESVLFAGDSGNDLAALTAGFRSILVANADRELVDQVKVAHANAGWNDRLFIANQMATSGVLEGCRWYGLG